LLKAREENSKAAASQANKCQITGKVNRSQKKPNPAWCNK